MKRTLLLVSLAIALAGCGQKHEETATPTTSPGAAPRDATQNQEGQNQEASEAPQAPSSGPVAIPETETKNQEANANAAATGPVDLDSLTLQLRGWMMKNRTGLPSSFDDWVAKSHIQVPPPPPGKKYAITKRAWVILVDK